MKSLFLIFLSILIITESCTHAGGPLKESTLATYLKNTIKPYLPYSIPSLSFSVTNGFSFNFSHALLSTVNFDSALMQLTNPNTVLFTLNGLVSEISFDWILSDGGNTINGNGVLALSGSKGSITAVVQPNHFKNTEATFTIGDLSLQTSNYPVIEPYWELLKPIVIDTLEREIPNLILEMNTEEIKTLVYPIVKGVEPVNIPDQNITVLGIYGALSKMVLNDIDFDSATMGLGAADNEVVFELVQLTALITNDWEFSALGIDQKGSGHILVNQTTVSVTVGIGQDEQGEFTVNLDDSKIDIGALQIVVDGGDHVVLNWLIKELEPLLASTIEATFQVVVCALFDGIPN